jgi:alkanesulfonate monooxygenase SsuD/methylene tetrahydromethanopterin reductase-like flavin-dependent oxidoreductase (luciferase family)
MTVTLDHVSAGRFILGIGAGCFEGEHRSLGFEFKPTGERLGALDEACRIIKGMLVEGQTTFRGRYYEVTDAVCSPRPLQEPRPPLMIAGQGEKILRRIVAEHAELWNTYGSTDYMQRLIDVMRRHGDRVGRDVDEIEKTIAIPFCYRASREREEADIKFAAALGRTSPDDARKQMMIGTRDECLDTIERYARCGVTDFILIAARSFDPEEISRFADEVIPACAHADS